MAAASLTCRAPGTRRGDMPRLRPVGSSVALTLVLTFTCLSVAVRSLRPSEELEGSATIIDVLHGGAFVRGHSVDPAADPPAAEEKEENKDEKKEHAEEKKEPAADPPAAEVAKPENGAAPPATEAAAPANGAASYEDQMKIFEAKKKLKEAFEKVKEEDKKRTGEESYIAKAVKLLKDTVAKIPPDGS